jgi:hypothetical protein
MQSGELNGGTNHAKCISQVIDNEKSLAESRFLLLACAGGDSAGLGIHGSVGPDRRIRNDPSAKAQFAQAAAQSSLRRNHVLRGQAEHRYARCNFNPAEKWLSDVLRHRTVASGKHL